MREILEFFKLVGIFLTSVLISLVIWWSFGWFLSGGEVNPLHWWVIGKLVYLFLSGATTGLLLDMFLNK